ncbi:MAG: hypothetical protein JJU27_10475 [Gammaproteobacteria bacterium]|nr:hypothetical protein [Gammaproteobacteria bacterium]
MIARLRSLVLAGAAALLSGAALLSMTALPAMAQVSLDPTLPISLDADSSDFDRRRNVVVFTGLKISQGPLEISADRAQASQIDFENSEWEFAGNVRIVMETSELRSNEATLTFLGFRLTRAVATGSPAQFEDSGTASGRTIRGRAGKLEYDLTNGIIRLSQGAWLAEGGNEITGATLLYNVPDERILAEGEGDRVRITIVPPVRNGEAAGSGADPQPSDGESADSVDDGPTRGDTDATPES